MLCSIIPKLLHPVLEIIKRVTETECDREREREREREQDRRERNRDREGQSEKRNRQIDRQISMCKNKEYKKTKSFIWIF